MHLQWGVDYIKVDGCYSDQDKYKVNYPKFGEALQQSGRVIVYSCSWPAYLGMQENTATNLSSYLSLFLLIICIDLQRCVISQACSFGCAFAGDNETTKPYDEMKAAGCNLWRNYADIDSSWSSLLGIIDHYGDYSEFLATVAQPGAWNDPGNCISSYIEEDSSDTDKDPSACVRCRYVACW